MDSDPIGIKAWHRF